MATIAENLSRIQSAKTDIKTAIEAKGVTVPSSATIDTYATYVSQISGGGGGSSSAETALKKVIDGSVTNIDIPSGTTAIYSYKFYGCSSLSSVTIPSSVTYIDSYAFSGCTSLSSVTIPDSVTTIGLSTFRGCKNLSAATIGSGCSNIRNTAFLNCSELRIVKIYAETPPTLGTNVFQDNNGSEVIFVPSGSVNTYKAANNWSTYKDRIQAFPTLEWTTILSDGSSVDLNGVRIYGLKGNIDNMTYLFGYTSNITVSYNGNAYFVNIGNGQYTNTYNGGNIELVFSDLGILDFYTTDASLAESYFGFQILTEA